MAENIKVCIYDSCGKKDIVAETLNVGGIEVLSDNENESLLAADFLVLAAADARELEEKEASSVWNFFLDEIRWKRKSSGEIVIIDCSDVSFSPSRLAYGLKKCKRFSLGKLSDAVAFMKGTAIPAPAPQSSYKPVQTSYESAASSYKSSEIAPKREASGCKHDHVFGEEEKKKEEARSNLDKMRDALAERKGSAVKDEKVMAIVEEARRRLEEKRKEQDSDPKLNPKFESRSSNPFENYPEGKKTETEGNDDKSPIFTERRGNPFADYPDYPKQKNNNDVTDAKNKLVGIVVAVVVCIILFTFVFAMAEDCNSSPDFPSFFVGVVERLVALIKTQTYSFMSVPALLPML